MINATFYGGPLDGDVMAIDPPDPESCLIFSVMDGDNQIEGYWHKYAPRRTGGYAYEGVIHASVEPLPTQSE